MLVAIVMTILFSGGCSGKGNESSKTVTNGKENKENVQKEIAVKGDTAVEIKDTLNLRIYFLKYSKVDFITEEMPSKNDTSVILVAEAAFTAGTSEEMAQGTVAGDHVSGGKRMKGYVCKRNNGAFVYYKNKPKFIHKNYDQELASAAKNGGCGFSQEMMIHNGRVVAHAP